MITLSADGSFSFFDLSKNENSRPVFIEKYKTVEQPNWIDTLERRILVCGDSPELSIYSMKS